MLFRLNSGFKLKENLGNVQIVLFTRLLDKSLFNWEAFATCHLDMDLNGSYIEILI
jgi:hypothetical protein